jgi:hypothetical protein
MAGNGSGTIGLQHDRGRPDHRVVAGPGASREGGENDAIFLGGFYFNA